MTCWAGEIDKVREAAAKAFPDVTTTVNVNFQRGGLVDVSVHAHSEPYRFLSERVYCHEHTGLTEDAAVVMAARAAVARVEAGIWDRDDEPAHAEPQP